MDQSDSEEERNNELENQYIMALTKQDPSIGQKLMKAHSLPEMEASFKIDLESPMEIQTPASSRKNKKSLKQKKLE